MIGVLFYFTARDENYINRLSPSPDVVVNVIGYQWSWQFQYPQYQVPGSATRVRDDERRAVDAGELRHGSCRCW